MSDETPVLHYQTESLLLSDTPAEGNIGVAVDKKTVWEFKNGTWTKIGFSTGN